MIYAISDIHGCADYFEKMISAIGFGEDDELYVLGDIIDRGEYPLKMIRIVMETRNIRMILGNHEDMMIQYYENRGEKEHERWMRNGGSITQKQFESLPAVARLDILSFFRSLPLHIFKDDFLMVHAGIKTPMGNEDDIACQTRRDLIWIRNDFFENKTGLSKTTIFGHTPTVVIRNKESEIGKHSGRSMSIWHDDKHHDKIGIDCGVVYPEYGGRLACIRLNDLKEFYI